MSFLHRWINVLLNKIDSLWAWFTEYKQKNVALCQFRNAMPLTTAAAANFTRSELATALRKNPYMVNIILAGYDKETGPSLYFLDYILIKLLVVPLNFVIKIVDKDGAREYAWRNSIKDAPVASALGFTRVPETLVFIYQLNLLMDS
ncbi:proteasome subunit beta type-2-A-like isoform X2 [Primulina huaijiensis]|uniref:proteasome subunit beta type-2-A-like isoform X2 n=1 Tax=Primulina huaijiensis TaxID=1492673 RepID=UPI003CC763FC